MPVVVTPFSFFYSTSLNLIMTSWSTIINKYLVNKYVLFLVLWMSADCFGKDSAEKPIDRIDGLHLQDIADKLSETLNKTNNEELGIPYVKVSA